MTIASLRRRRAAILSSIASLSVSFAVHAQVPEWIWHRYQGALPLGAETVFVRKEFPVTAGAKSAELKVCGDDEATVFVNGKQVLVARSKADPKSVHYSATAVDVTGELKPGQNLIAAQLRNSGGPFGVIARLEMTLADGRKQTLITDSSWLTSSVKVEGWEKPGFKAAGWTPAHSIGKEGDNPWFEVLTPPTTAKQLTLPPGFKSELLREARAGEGSWIAMTIDDKGRLIISPQMLVSSNYGGMLRFTLGPNGRIVKEEKINLPIGGAQGLLYAHGSLYVNGYSGAYTLDKLGFYRVRDTDGDDQFDKVEFLKQLYNRGGSHGPHGLALGPDGMIYHVAGDYAKVVDDVSPNSPHKGFQEDLLLPRIWDPSGHARGIVAPCGTIQRTDKDGKKWELFAAGFRNPYDLAFNAAGELFTYDADMEYDTGLPWYRATRVYQVVSAGEYGQRAGSSKWPYYYPDSLPPATDIGLGSPCGVKFGTGSKFPSKYQKALFLCDWAWGHIYAVHFKPQGAGYAATFESFAQGRPLNAMDIEFGQDGAMYLITGGNDTQTGLYRISYVGTETKAPRLSAVESKAEQEAVAARALRRKLESFHGRPDSAAVEFAWPHLNSEDRWIRYAARIAIEWQEPLLWQSRALTETQPRAALTALLALARMGKPEVKHDLLNSLLKISPTKLNEAQQLEWLRDFGVVFTRLGGPSAELRREIAARIDPLYPAKSDALNRELCQLLVFLEAPSVVGKSLSLLATARMQEQQIHYVHCLRNVRYGWTLPQRETYFKWFADTAARYRGGVSFYKFLAQIKKDAIATVPPSEHTQLAAYLKDFEAASAVKAVAPRPFVKEWKLEELLPELDKAENGRSFAKGKAAFEASQCILCHRFGQDGGVVGPDLTGVANRFSRRDILESIINPSKVVMEQYQNTTIIKTDGSSESGRLVDETGQKVVLITNPLTLERLEIPKKEIKARRPSELSPMPEGLVNVLKKEEILDLVAYLESGGNPGFVAFRK